MNLKLFRHLALFGLLLTRAAFGILCSTSVGGEITLPAMEADETRGDWSRQASFPWHLPGPHSEFRMKFFFPRGMDPMKEDFVLLFYQGEEVNEDTVRSGRLASIAEHLQLQWDRESQIGGVAIAGQWSHLHLARLIPKGRKILGGVRYHAREQKNSSVFNTLSGPLVEQSYFSTRF